MKPLKDEGREPFSEDPELVKANFARLVKAFLEAPQDPPSRQAAIGEVLMKISEEKKQREKEAKERRNSKPGIASGVGAEEPEQMEALPYELYPNSQVTRRSRIQGDETEGRPSEPKSDLVRQLDELLQGKSPIESLYGKPAGEGPPSVALSPGGLNMIAVAGGFAPYHGAMLTPQHIKNLRTDILKIAALLDEREQRKAGRLVKNLEQAAQVAGEEGVMLFVAPLFAWRRGFFRTDPDDEETLPSAASPSSPASQSTGNASRPKQS